MYKNINLSLSSDSRKGLLARGRVPPFRRKYRPGEVFEI